MYPPLRKAIWSEIDAAVERCFGAKPCRRLAMRRVYRLDRHLISAFLVAEHDDFAGGRFSFLGALGHGAQPDSSTVYSKQLECPGPGLVCLASSDVLGVGDSTISIDGRWTTPGADRIREALSLQVARSFLQDLGVTETERHHLLSFGILQALGVHIPERDYLAVLDHVRPLILASLAGPVAETVARVKAMSRDCSSSACGQLKSGTRDRK